MMSDDDVNDNLTQTTFLHQPFPPAAEKPQYQRPYHVTTTRSLNTRSDMKGVTHYRSELETKANESYFNMEQLLDMVSRTEDVNQQSLPENTNIAPSSSTFKLSSSGPSGNHIEHVTEGTKVKSEKRHKKKKSKEQNSSKMGKKEKIDQSQRDARTMMEEVSRSRSKFNRHRDTLPAINSLPGEASLPRGKLPEVKMYGNEELNTLDNNVIDVIRKNENRVREATYLREISHGFINAGMIESSRNNETIDIIEKHEYENNKMYDILHGNYTVGHLRATGTGNDGDQASGPSRCSSVASRRGAA